MRHPLAAVVCGNGDLLCIANQRSGSLTIVDLESREVTSEFRFGKRFSDIAASKTGAYVFVTDELAHELLVAKVSKRAMDVDIVQRIETPRSPVNVAVSEDERLISVVGLWSHRVALFDVTDISASGDPLLTHTGTVRLPVAAREQVFVGRTSPHLVIADAFGGDLIVIDPNRTNDDHPILMRRQLPGHNLRGLAISPDGETLITSYQTLSSLARADYNDVIWGNLMQNVVREVPVARLFKTEDEWLNESRVTRLGEAGDGAADPSGIAVLSDGEGVMIALSGVDEVAVHLRGTTSRIAVDARPVEIVWDENRQVAYVICSLDDSIAVVDPAAGEVVTRISLGPRPQPTARDRGERLFYDGHQSLDGWLSCHSCHPDGHTNHGLADTMSDDSFDTPKKVPSLLGVRDANPWAWNGTFRELHEQVRSSFVSTMRGDGVGAEGVNDLVAFLHTLQPPPPVDEGTWTSEDLAQIEAGRRLFESLECRKCHVPPLTYTIDMTFDVGLTDEAGLKKFNPPLLRGVSQRRSFFHDGRALSLRDVFETHGHQLDRNLSESELESLLKFLESL